MSARGLSQTRYYLRWLFSVLLLALAAIVLATCGQQADQSHAANDPTVIKHTIFIIKENRSFDNYFGDFPGADGATWGLTSAGQSVPLAHIDDCDGSVLCNAWACAQKAMNGGRMDQFDLVTGNLDAYGPMMEADIPSYWSYARRFVLADRFFTSVHGPSFPNHLFTVAPQSGGVMDNVDASLGGTNCDGSPSGLVPVMDDSGNVSYQSPCFDFLTLPDLLEAAGVSWRYYGRAAAYWELFATSATARPFKATLGIRAISQLMLLRESCPQSAGSYRLPEWGNIRRRVLAKVRTGPYKF